MSSKPRHWRRRNGFVTDLEAMWLILMLGMCIVVFDTTGNRLADAGLSKEATFAFGMAGVPATCLSFLAIVGLLVTINLLRYPFVKRKTWSVPIPAIAIVLALLVTSLPMYYLVLWLAGI